MRVERIVYIVDDDAAVARSLKILLLSAGIISTAYESAADFLAAIGGLRPGCLLLDVWMPGMTGLELQDWLKGIGFSMPIVVMTEQGDTQTAVKAMKAGAVDFIEKPFDDESLLATLDEAWAKAGELARSNESAEALARVSSLTPREREVLDAMVEGRLNKTIAFDLGISVRTVEAHRARLFERLGVNGLAEAVRLAVLAKLA
jgi:two-component system response regulator FixJ